MRRKIKIGISACLIGKKVRYNGSHKLNRNIKRWASSKGIELIPVCPEVECGLPVPREPMILIGNPEAPRLLTIETGIDYTDKLKRWSKEKLKALKKEKLSGFIFKSRSPSCGLRSVKIKGHRKKINGLFTSSIIDSFPEMPVTEDDRLKTPASRERFFKKIKNHMKEQKA
ncbi:MAG: DUF523 domain-containing protein [Thermodesulfovibrionales bacterium]|nr:DUF523 domain-containing protein [Thermodesulfovibrionales bacterium]